MSKLCWPLSSAVVVLVLTAVPLAAEAGWKQLDSVEHKLVFNAPGLKLTDMTVRNFINEDIGGKMEWLCWRNFAKKAPNACIAYQRNSRRPAPYRRVREIPASYAKKFFRGTRHEFIGKVSELPSALGDFESSRLVVRTKGHSKSCVVFSRYFDGNRKFVLGWYCGQVGTEMSKDTIKNIVATIGIEGKGVPSEKITFEDTGGDGDDFLEHGEILSLISDHTLTGTFVAGRIEGKTFDVFMMENGELSARHSDGKMGFGKWKVMAGGKLCTWQSHVKKGKRQCRLVQKDSDGYLLLRPRDNTPMATFRVLLGNAKKLEIP